MSSTDEPVFTTQSSGFVIITLLASAFFVGFSIANLVFFNRIRRARGGGGVSEGEATAMLWVNGILLIISLFILFWAIYQFIGEETKQTVKRKVAEPVGKKKAKTPKEPKTPAEPEVKGPPSRLRGFPESGTKTKSSGFETLFSPTPKSSPRSSSKLPIKPKLSSTNGYSPRNRVVLPPSYSRMD